MRISDWSSDVCSSDLQVTSVVRASDTSFQVKWVESAFERGSLASTSRWTAILTVTVKPPNNADTLRKNPLGLYVNAIDWSRELDAPVSKSAPPTPITTPAPPQSNIPQIGRASCRERVCQHV